MNSIRSLEIQARRTRHGEGAEKGKGLLLLSTAYRPPRLRAMGQVDLWTSRQAVDDGVEGMALPESGTSGKPRVGISFPQMGSDTLGGVEGEQRQEKRKKGGGFEAFGFSYPVRWSCVPRRVNNLLQSGAAGVLCHQAEGLQSANPDSAQSHTRRHVRRRRGRHGPYRLREGAPRSEKRGPAPTVLQAISSVGFVQTAAFLLPMLERLKEHSNTVGVRGVVLSPTRELAIQTLKFFRELGRNTTLRACLLVGGDSMEAQFEGLSRNPDVLIATPGRLMHHLEEVGMSLNAVQVRTRPARYHLPVNLCWSSSGRPAARR